MATFATRRSDRVESAETVAVRPALSYMQDLGEVITRVEASDASGARVDFETAMTEAARTLVETAHRGHKVMLVGNGGSAALVSHMQNDLAKAAQIPALVFNEAPLLTAYANDESYEVAFERIAALWAQPGDLLIAVSSSGKSPNILRTVACCVSADVTVLTMSGFGPENPLRTLGHLNLYAPATSYGLVELAHACLLHYLSDAAAALAAVRGDGPRRPMRTVARGG